MDADVWKTSLGHLKKVTTSYDQTRRRLHDVWQKKSDLYYLENVWLITSSRRLIYDISSFWRRRIYLALRTSDLWRSEDAWFTTSWRCLWNKVAATPTPLQNKLFFILFCLKFSENFKCSAKVSINKWNFVNHYVSLTTLISKNQKLVCRIRREEREEIPTFTSLLSVQEKPHWLIKKPNYNCVFLCCKYVP